MPITFTQKIARNGVCSVGDMSRRACAPAVFAMACALMIPGLALAGGPTESHAFKVLPPVVRGNLAIYPVLSGRNYDAGQLLTLDEGIHSGQVVISEEGGDRGLIRPAQAVAPPHGGAQVNRLVLYNNSSRPLLLLAAEIVTGGKQDRVIGADRIVPPQSGPMDLNVFCVEPGRWVGATTNFGSMSAQMVQPSVRMPAMAERNQERVWDNVRASNRRMAASLSPPEAAAIEATSSYAKVFASPQVAKALSGYGGTEGERAILNELRSKGAVGVAVAVDGQLVWADIFASTDLLAKYWPKLMRSYVAEAMTSANGGGVPDVQQVERYVNELRGGREVVETEPGIFRRSDVSGEGYRVFELTSLLPKMGFTVHIAKMND